jgi:DNA-binding GntR family transcriptional regulator
MWRQSVARYNERERRQIRAKWRDYHESQAERHRRILAALIAHHEAEAAKLLEGEPSEATEGAGS